MDTPTRGKRITAAGILLGLGLGGFFDGIVLHQILQWHHMVSHVDDYPTTTVAGLEANTLGDGLFHAATWIATLAGVWLLWTVLAVPNGAWSTRAFIGLLLMGWGLFNVVEGVIDHHLLELHHVREASGNQLIWDLAFLAWGAAMLIGGWYLYRSAPVRSRGQPPATVRRVSLPRTLLTSSRPNRSAVSSLSDDFCTKPKDQQQHMSESPNGYQAFWLRVARHIRLSEAAKADRRASRCALGIRAGRGAQPHSCRDRSLHRLSAIHPSA